MYGHHDPNSYHFKRQTHSKNSYHFTGLVKNFEIHGVWLFILFFLKFLMLYLGDETALTYITCFPHTFHPHLLSVLFFHFNSPPHSSAITHLSFLPLVQKKGNWSINRLKSFGGRWRLYLLSLSKAYSLHF